MNKRKQFCLQWLCLAVDDVVLFIEPDFGPITCADEGRCSLEAPVSLCSVCPAVETVRNPTFVTETQSAHF